MKIIVFGLGALGTAFATFLKEKGETVYGLTKEKYIPYLKNRKIFVEGIWGNHKAVLDGIYSDITQVPEKDIDLIILTVKSYDTEKALKEIKKKISDKTYLLIAQNGYGNYEKAVKELGEGKVLLGRVIFGAKVIKPGHVKITVNADDVRIGDSSGKIPDEDVIKIACLLKHSGIPSSFDKNVYKTLWDKILYNCALNPLGALLECNYGKLAQIPETKEMMDRIIDEIFSVASANNIQLNWKNSDEYKKHFYENLIPPTKEHFPSMYYDIKEGKKTEIDALNGAIVELGKKKGIKTPVNEVITNLIKAKEKIKREESLPEDS